MRVLQPNLGDEEKKEIADFSSWLLEIGNGQIGVDDEHDSDTKWVEIPEKFLIPHHEHALKDLVRFIYDHDMLHSPSASMFCDKAIVCPKNDTSDEINKLILHSLPAKPTVYLSIDSAIPRSNERGDTEILYPLEYLNLLNFNGFPTHRLEFKVGAPIMLLRNMNQMAGLCNGTRMIITQLLPRLIEAQVITGIRMGHKALIHRVDLNHDDKELPFILKRKHHGHLYVALSRATSPAGIKILISRHEERPSNCTKNIVYSDFLSKLDVGHVQYDVNDDRGQS